MMERYSNRDACLVSPWRAFVQLLVIIFSVEAFIMFLLEMLLPGSLGGLFVAITDAVLLAVLSAPFLWHFLVRPLQNAAVAEQMQAATIVSRSVDGIITANEKGLIESFNPAAEAIFGYRAEEVLGRPMTLLMPERYRAAHCEAFRRACLTGEASLAGKTIESHGLRKDGSEFPLEISAAAWKLQKGARSAGILRDVSERRRAEEALAQSERRYRELVEKARDVVFTISPDGTITSLNPAFEAITGWPPSEWLGKHFAGIVHPEDLAFAIELFQRTSGGESPPISELRVGRKDGGYWVAEVAGAPRFEGGEIVGALGIARDVTALKRARAALLETTSYIRLLQEITSAANEAATLEEAMPRALKSICSTIAWPVGHVYLLGGDGAGELVSKGIWYRTDPERFNTFREVTEATRFTVDVGLPGRIMSSKKPEWISDVTKDPKFLRAWLGKEIGIRAGFGVPVMVGQQAVAVLEFYSDRIIEIDEPLLEVMVQVGAQLARLAERERSEKEKQLQLNRLRTLHEIGTTLTTSLDMGKVLDLLLEKIDKLLPYAASGVRLKNPETAKCEPITSRNIDQEAFEAARNKAGTGLSELVLESRSPVVINDVRTGPIPALAGFFSEQGLVSYLGLPLNMGDEILGVLSVLTKKEHYFTDDDIVFLSSLTNVAAAAIYNSQLYGQVRKKSDTLATLYAIAATANQTMDLEELLQAIIKEFTTIFCFDAMRIYLFDSQRERLHLAAASAVKPSQPKPPRVGRLGGGISATVAKTGEALVFEDVHNDPLYQTLSQSKYSEKTDFSCTAVFPIKVKQNVVGVAIFANQKPRRLTTDEMRLIESMTNEIGVAIENANLFQKTKAQAVELEKANLARDEFLGFVSHELKTPLNALNGYLALMQDNLFGEINQEQDKALKKMAGFCDDLLTMINSLLLASKIEGGGIDAAKEGVHLGDFLNELRANYSVPLNKEVALNWDYAAPLPVITTDGAKLKHILQNLIDNALKYTKKGNITVSARYRDETTKIEFKVADTGIGIAEDWLPIIFDKFRQANGSQARSCGGVGLGLYIVKKYVELLGGTIEAQSEIGKGSTFTVAVPSGS